VGVRVPLRQTEPPWSGPIGWSTAAVEAGGSLALPPMRFLGTGRAPFTSRRRRIPVVAAVDRSRDLDREAVVLADSEDTG
jgi:hypothetical protein